MQSIRRFVTTCAWLLLLLLVDPAGGESMVGGPGEDVFSPGSGGERHVAR